MWIVVEALREMEEEEKKDTGSGAGSGGGEKVEGRFQTTKMY